MQLPGVEGDPGSVYTEHNGGWNNVHQRQNRRLNDGQGTGSLKGVIKKAAEDFAICLESPTRVNCCNQAWKKQMHELLYICVTFGQTVPNFSNVDERQPLKFALCGCQQWSCSNKSPRVLTGVLEARIKKPSKAASAEDVSESVSGPAWM